MLFVNTPLAGVTDAGTKPPLVNQPIVRVVGE
jgi:hypothetical protein